MAGEKKYKLDVKPENPFSLIGILSDETDFKLSWLINKKLKINLSRDEDLNWQSRDLPNPQAFPVYSDKSNPAEPVRLIKNRSSEGICIKGYKQVDYLLTFANNDDPMNLQNLIEKIQKIKSVRGAYFLDPEALRPWLEQGL